MSEATTSKATVRLLKLLARGKAETNLRDGVVILTFGDGTSHSVPAEILAAAEARGLLSRQENVISLPSEGRAFLRRAAAEREEAFLDQHRLVDEVVVAVDGAKTHLRINREESPLACLLRLREKNGSPFLPEEAFAAGEKLLADFTRGQLQPRMTASWEPRLSGRGKGDRGGMADLSDNAVAARLSVNRALEAIGPELSGVALDVCCFMKGLETVERERQWPARSAKLMLRTALLALSRHYAPKAAGRRQRLEHWGDENYRPELTLR